MNSMRWLIPVLATALLGACASRPPAPEPVPVYGSSQRVQTSYGRVIGIETLRGSGQSGQKDQTTGTGAVVGGVTGAIIGRQFGNSNSGKNTGTVLGAIAGAVIGNEIEKDHANVNADAGDRTRITVQIDRGGKRFFVHPDAAGLRLGDRVRIVGDRLYRY